MQSLCVVVGDDLEDDGIDLCSAAKVVSVLDHGDSLANIPAFQLVRTGADGVLEVVGFPHILTLQLVLRQDGHGHVVQECEVGLGQNECDLGVGDNLDLTDLNVVGIVLGTVVGIHDSFDGELDIVSGELLAVVPLNITAQLKSPGHGSIVISPGLGQTCNGLAVLVQLYQGVEQQVLDLAVFVHDGVDGVIVAGAVDQGGLLVLLGAACEHGNNHQGCQKQCQKFLHCKIRPFFFWQNSI